MKRSSLPGVFLTVVCVLGALEPISDCRADLQDPPSRQHGPIRKLSRGLANIAFGVSELGVSIGFENQEFGNSGAASYGIISGLTRTLVRLGAGFYEVLTFPVPSVHQSYAPVLPSAVPWVVGGYEEFPPELGFESRFDYVRIRGPHSRVP